MTMDKDTSMHLEEVGSHYATPFVENKELERRCCADRLLAMDGIIQANGTQLMSCSLGYCGRWTFG
jgi:hypothetical protein